ncbi:HU family DNA-binding protein [Parabacteroides sp. PF5-6]|uniref:HU family DNA-binding protein n=1 Tax=Parabacteroides sp. PF5-6 TaxID=1742403 RepID=UPI002405106A|nr:HU family DNA-binding protein [Parabacteroides sp. PF5-6]MDF9830848.1 putative histone-like DNA-binding protein [Parabacteroides sp. PF5-6]
MAIKYKLVLRRDPSKSSPADSKLYYAQSQANGMCTFDELCDTVADRSTATTGDVKLVLDGLMRVLRTRLLAGDVVQVGELGNFRATLGSSGVVNKDNFNTEMIKTRRVRFHPGVLLKDMTRLFKVERIDKPEEEEGGGHEGGV